MQVSSEEYEAIETVYLNCDLEKDDFCKMWAKMNAERISRYNKQKIKDMIQNVGEDNRWIGCMLINFSPRDLRKIGKALGIKCDDLKFMSLKEVYSLI